MEPGDRGEHEQRWRRRWLVSVGLAVRSGCGFVDLHLDEPCRRAHGRRRSSAGSPDFLNVDCPTTSLCVATTLKGQVAVSTDPTGGASAWSLKDVDGNDPLYGISCPSTSECIATDPIAANVITTTNPTGGPARGAFARSPIATG